MMAGFRLYEHRDFIGVREDGICLWRRRAGPPTKRKPPAEVQSGAARSKYLKTAANNYVDILDELELQEFRIRWLVRRAFTHHSRAALVATYAFGGEVG